MQSIDVHGLERFAKALEESPGVLRQVRAEVMEDMGRELLGDVQQRIGGSGRVADVQTYYVGSGKGYVAVRAKSETYLDGYAAGYVTNALEGGHKQEPGRFVPAIKARLRREWVIGKHMYRDTQSEADRLAEEGARRIEDAVVNALNGGSA